MMTKIALYPGTFDPITLGHLDIAVRAKTLFDKVIIAVSTGTEKKTLFSLEQRIGLIEESLKNTNGIIVKPFSSLLVEFAQSEGAMAIVRGLRAVSDFEYERQLAIMNRKLSPQLETVFLPSAEDKIAVSSSLIKEVASLQGNISDLVPVNVASALTKAFAP